MQDCRVCGQPIQPERRRGRPRLTHRECLPARAKRERDGTSWRQCFGCGEPYRAKMRDQRACGRWCGHFVRYGAWPSSRVPARLLRLPDVQKEPPPLAWRVFIVDCAICSKTFATPYTVTTCSESCAIAKRAADRRRHKDRERARKKAVSRADIYKRDDWRCHLCGKKVARGRVVPHPLAPTLDHVIPLACGGTHEPANVKTAHYRCNSSKGARGGGEQLLLIG